MDTYTKYTDWIIDYINNELPLLKIKYIIFRFPSFDVYCTYLITDTREIHVLKFPNLWYYLISNKIANEKIAYKKIKKKIEYSKIKINHSERRILLKCLDDEFLLKKRMSRKNSKIMDGTTLFIFSKNKNLFERYRNDVNGKLFKFIEDKLVKWDYVYFNIKSHSIEDYEKHITKLTVSKFIYNSKISKSKDSDFDLNFPIMVIETMIYMVLSGEGIESLKSRKGRDYLLSLYKLADPLRILKSGVSKIDIAIRPLKSPIDELLKK